MHLIYELDQRTSNDVPYHVRGYAQEPDAKVASVLIFRDMRELPLGVEQHWREILPKEIPTIEPATVSRLCVFEQKGDDEFMRITFREFGNDNTAWGQVGKSAYTKVEVADLLNEPNIERLNLPKTYGQREAEKLAKIDIKADDLRVEAAVEHIRIDATSMIAQRLSKESTEQQKLDDDTERENQNQKPKIGM